MATYVVLAILIVILAIIIVQVKKKGSCIGCSHKNEDGCSSQSCPHSKDQTKIEKKKEIPEENKINLDKF